MAARLGRRRELFRKRDDLVRELFDDGRQLRVGGRERGDGAGLVLVHGFGRLSSHGERVKRLSHLRRHLVTDLVFC